ncbi:hypothetical protein ABLE93_17685 [Xanthobacter sp. KR7-65]|uniref:hypothetical protein n=1 Tax=Xanthobacter sp. KR7-65 TaxID=3156612 RepID=UPI0032B53CFE
MGDLRQPRAGARGAEIECVERSRKAVAPVPRDADDAVAWLPGSDRIGKEGKTLRMRHLKHPQLHIAIWAPDAAIGGDELPGWLPRNLYPERDRGAQTTRAYSRAWSFEIDSRCLFDIRGLQIDHRFDVYIRRTRSTSLGDRLTSFNCPERAFGVEVKANPTDPA